MTDTSINSFNNFAYPGWNTNLGNNWNTNFAWNNQWNNSWNNYNTWNAWGGGTTSSSGTSSKEKTPEEVRKERAAKQAANAKTLESNNKKLQELRQKLEALGQGLPDEQGNINPALSKENVDAQLEMLNKGKKNEDGSVAIYDKDLSKMSTMDKVGRGFMNALSGMGNVFKSLAGFDKEGKWNPVKCAINVGIAAGVIALCSTGVLAPAGAALAASLGGGAVATALGTTVASLPAILAATGVVTGGYMAAKGAVNTYNACESNSIEEFDNATQDIGAGVFIGGSSFMGLKSMGSAAGLSGAARFNPFAIGKAGMNVAAESMLTAAGENIVYNTNAAGQSTSVSLKNVDSSLWKHIGVGRKAVLSMPAEQADKSFKISLDEAKEKLWTEAAEVDVKLNAARAAGDTKTAAILKMKQDTLLNNLNSLDDAKDFAGWKAATAGNKSSMEQFNGYMETLESNGQVEINGHTFTSADKSELASVLKDLKSQDKALIKMIKGLREQRFTSMRKLAAQEKYSTEAKNFGFEDASGWNLSGIKGQLINLWRAFSGKYDTKLALSKGIAMKGAGQAFMIADPTYFAYEVSGPGRYIPNIATCFVSPHQFGGDKTLTAEEATQLQTQLAALQKQYTDSEAALTKEIAQLEEANRKIQSA